MTAAVDDTLQALLSAAAAIWPAPARVESPDDAQPYPSDRSEESTDADQPTTHLSARQQPDPPDQPARPESTQPLEDRHVVAELLVVPSLSRPRLVVPADAPRVAAAAFGRDSDDVSTRTRLVRAAAARALRVPGVARVLRHPRLSGSRDRRPNRMTVTVPAGSVVRSLQRRLSELVDAEVQLCFGVGSPRANRKPVVQAVDRTGRTVAWTKLGLDPVSRDLVRGEAEALRAFWSEERPLRHLTAPHVLYAGPWGDAELLVLSPLRPGASRLAGGRGPRAQQDDTPAYAASAGAPVPAERPRRGQLPREAMTELAERLGTEIRPLADTEFWRKIRKIPELADGATAVETAYGQRMVVLGSWHGDWTPWNMRTDRDRVLLWDFERFAHGVPVGLDVAHFRFQSALHTGGEQAAERLLIDGPLVDEPGGELLTSAYLLELARRWVRAAEPATGAPLRARTGWLLRVLEAWLPHVSTDWAAERVRDH